MGNVLKTLALPDEIEHRLITMLREKLNKFGVKVVEHGRYVTFQLTENAIPRPFFTEIPRPKATTT